MKAQFKKYLLRMGVGFIAYTFGIAALNRFYSPHSSQKYWLILFPVIPIIYLVTVIVRTVSEMDEMKRKIVTEAMAFTGLATGFTCFSYIFVRQSGGPEIPLDYAFYVMWAYYFIGLFFSWRRYK